MVNKVLVLEAFYGGSHRQLADLLHRCFPESKLLTVPGTKWPWRMRCGALSLAVQLEDDPDAAGSAFDALFCSSSFNLAEFLSLTAGKLKLSDGCRKVVYFHENQLVYPIRERKDRDFQFGYNQILSALVADVVLFNSAHCMETFLGGNCNTFLKFIPDLSAGQRNGIREKIVAKSSVLYFPVQFPPGATTPSETPAGSAPLRICWPHRWEHDKNPWLFFETLIKLKLEAESRFELVVLGQTYDEVPSVFEEARETLAAEIVHWGYAESKDDYFRLLAGCDVAVSTADHEFFGVAMLEAAQRGAYPICPNRLAYPEIFPPECLYNTDQQLFKMLRQFCKHPNLARSKRQKLDVDFGKFSWETLKPRFENALFGGCL